MKADLITQIKKIAEDIYQTLGSGHSECAYDEAMQVGLRHAGVPYESQKVIELKYLDHYVGEAYPDLVVRSGKDAVVVEIKAIGAELGPPEEQQLRNYLNILKIQQGLLINFQLPNKAKKKQGKTALEMREISL